MGTVYHVGSDSRRFEDAYAEPLAERELPRYRMPQVESDPRTVRNLIRDELYLDGNAAQNVATFCTTYDDDDVRYLMDMSVNKNLIDKDEYPQSAEIENRCVHMLGALWNAPRATQAMGCSTEGSSEACMLGGLALKWRWRADRQARGRRPAGRTWSAARCRSAGTSSAATGMWRCARSRWSAGVFR